MRGDVTRQTFRSGEHYRSVLQQQGRVQLDADWNEQADIQAYLDRTVNTDLVGVSGAPRGNAGMEITDKAGNSLPTKVTDADLRISAGHYYVDGILCENDGPVPLVDQPDRPGVPLEKADGDYIAYLDVWFEHLTVFERPALREVALGGPDTTTRARTIWQVRLRKAGDPEPTNPGACLRAEAVPPTGDASTPCVVGPTAGYRRLENQLYRVEVFDPSVELNGDAGTPTFLWSRENGSVVASLTDPTPSLLTIAAAGRDDRLAFRTGNTVEVTDLARTRRGEQGFLAKLGVANGTLLAVAEWYGATPTPEQLKALQDPVARRWDSAGPVPIPTGAAPGTEQRIELEGGVHVTFEAGGVYRTGDYWQIPARTANLDGVPGVGDLAGNIEWPRDDDGTARFEPPAGVVHHYTDIAQLTRTGDLWDVDRDKRPIFDPLAERLDVTTAGGDGQEALPRTWLDQPLRVAVTRSLRPVEGKTVRFTAHDDGALLDPDLDGTGDASEAEVKTDEDGIATCGWQLAPGGPRTQRVTARLLDPDGDAPGPLAPTGPVLGFTASLSFADRVGFRPGSCTAMAGAETVQDALIRLAGVPVLVPAGGDGQIGVAGSTLPALIQVLVSGCGRPVTGVKVRFATAEGTVLPVGVGGPSGPSLDVVASGTGVARCRWQLGPDLPLQTLTATLLDADGNPDPRALPLTFLAGVVPPALTVDRVELTGPGTVLADGALVAADDLADGLAVVVDRAPDAAVAGSPALTVTLDLPFPFSASDRQLWTDAIAGTVPLSLGGDVAVADAAAVPAVTWTPDGGAVAFLDGLFTQMQKGQRGDALRGHVRLAGSVLGAAARDVERWFWLVAKRTTLVLLPHRDGRLRLPSAQRAIALSVPRDELRAALPADVVVADVPPDPVGAARAAARIFTAASPERPLRLVVDARYGAAAAAIKDGLDTVGVTLELLDARDPAVDATRRLAAGETVDGVLTDGASAGPVLAVAGFTTEVPL